MTSPTITQDKQVTIPVPEDRVPEFYAFYARFLDAGRPGRGRRGGRRGSHGQGRHGGHRCGHPTGHDDTTQAAPVAGDTPVTPAPPQAPAA